MNIFKDTRDVPQFYMIFLDIVFPFYLQNLLIPPKRRVHYQAVFGVRIF